MRTVLSVLACALLVTLNLGAQTPAIPPPSYTAQGTATAANGTTTAVTATGVMSDDGTTVAAGVSVSGCVGTVTLNRRMTGANPNGSQWSYYTGRAVICGVAVQLILWINYQGTAISGTLAVSGGPTIPLH